MTRPIADQESIPIYFLTENDRPVSEREPIPVFIANPNSIFGTAVYTLAGLTAINPTIDDVLYIVDAPGTTPVPSKTTVLALGTTIAANIPSNGLMVGSRQLFTLGGRAGIFATGTPTAMLEIDQFCSTGTMPVLALDQGDADEAFLDYVGTSATGTIASISTTNGDGSVEGPKNFSSTQGWAFAGMVKKKVNHTNVWMPYYTEDTS